MRSNLKPEIPRISSQMKVGSSSIQSIRIIFNPTCKPLGVPPKSNLSRSYVRLAPNPIDTMEGKLHIYHPKRRLLLFEYTKSQSHNAPTASNILLFVGGMFDNFRTTSYVDELAENLAKWRVCHIQLSSTTRNFGTFTLSRDVDEIETCINFIRSTSQIGNRDSRVVLMGHSTGCQDTLTYIYSKSTSSRPPIQGAILQAAVSDREAVLNSISTKPDVRWLYDQCMTTISSTPKDQHKSTLLPLHWTTPLFGPAPMSITRFLSLVSPPSPSNPSPDDLFSSDIPSSELDKTFGQIGAQTSPIQPNQTGKNNILILLSGSDEYCPSSVDKAALLSRWKQAIYSGGAELHPSSQIIQNGLHDLSGSTDLQVHARQVVFRTAVSSYLDDIVGSDKQNIESGVAGMKL